MMASPLLFHLFIHLRSLCPIVIYLHIMVSGTSSYKRGRKSEYLFLFIYIQRQQGKEELRKGIQPLNNCVYCGDGVLIFTGSFSLVWGLTDCGKVEN